MTAERIFLIGLSGSGKSTVARLAAARLGWEAADTDRMIESAAGCTVEKIFAEEGEPAFRAREVQALRDVNLREKVVVATGGGAPTTPDGREEIGRGFSVWLAVSPAVAAKRLEGHEDAEARPLLQGGAEERLAALDAARRPIYELAGAAIDVDDLTPEQVASEVLRLWAEARPAARPRPALAESWAPLPGVAAVVRTPTASYPVVVRRGGVDELGRICHDLPLGGRAFVITDDVVGPLYARRAADALRASGIRPVVCTIPAGEANKNLVTLQAVYDRMLAERVERADFAVCLGGGVVTDLGGFAAATILRGIDFVHVPTTLLGMMDAAVGGKLAVDHPRGKNMVGLFAQPRAVVIDPATLESLPRRQVVAGAAELIKHGLILDEALVRDIEDGAGDVAVLMSEPLIARSVAIKAAIVSEDEREAGRRTLLNYGHTRGHAIETVTGYDRYLHGEAIAVGMHAAGRIAVELGLMAQGDLDRQQAVLEAYGLPGSAPGVDADAVLEATRGDKKVRGGAVRWVLLERIGQATIRADVPDAIVRAAAEAVLR